MATAGQNYMEKKGRGRPRGSTKGKDRSAAKKGDPQQEADEDTWTCESCETVFSDENDKILEC